MAVAATDKPSEPASLEGHNGLDRDPEQLPLDFPRLQVPASDHGPDVLPGAVPALGEGIGL